MYCKTNYFHFIESLDEREIDQDGGYPRTLFTGTVVPACREMGVGCRYHIVKSTTELRVVFEAIRSETNPSTHCPLIHFELHGFDGGITCTDGSAMNWNELRIELAQINRLSGNNTTVTLASCQGANSASSLYQGIDFTNVSRSPATITIGANHDIPPKSLERGYGSFFNELIRGADGISAFRQLADQSKFGPGFTLETCENAFCETFEHYYEQSFLAHHLSERALITEVDSLVNDSEIMNGKVPTLEHAIEILNYLTNYEFVISFAEEVRRTYFWIDQFPDNETRFKRPNLTGWNHEQVDSLKYEAMAILQNRY